MVRLIEDLSGYSIEIFEKRSKWRSGRIPLNPEGKFITEVLADREKSASTSWY